MSQPTAPTYRLESTRNGQVFPVSFPDHITPAEVDTTIAALRDEGYTEFRVMQHVRDGMYRVTRTAH